MRPAEIFLSFLLVSLFVVLWVSPATWARLARWVKMLPALVLLVVAWHVWQEKYRWQMVPMFILFGVFLWMWLRRATRSNAIHIITLQRHTQQKFWRVVGTGLGLFAVFIAIALPIILPVPSLPVPNGVYQVGTTSYQLLDSTRDETYTDDPTDKRELMIQVWYPATAKSFERPAPWLSRVDIFGPAIATYLRLPSFALDHAALVRSNSYTDAPISEAETNYPVIIYSHGWNSLRQINANQSEQLASHGYIVVSVDHPYSALVTRYDDNRIVLNKPSILPKRTDANWLSSVQQLEETHARDVIFVMDELMRMNAEDLRFAGRMDLARLGIMGHSTGAGAIVSVCARDPRCKVGVGQDTWVEPVLDSVIDAGLKQPFLFMRSQQWANGNKNDQRLAQLIANSNPTARSLVTISGSFHNDFVLTPLLSPLAPLIGLKGPIPAHRIIPLIDDFQLAFFNQYLKGMPDALTQVSANYPEAVLVR